MFLLPQRDELGICLHDGAQDGRVVTLTLLLDVQDTERRRDGDLTVGEITEERGLSRAVSSHKTIPSSVRKNEVGVGDELVVASRDGDVLDSDVCRSRDLSLTRTEVVGSSEDGRRSGGQVANRLFELLDLFLLGQEVPLLGSLLVLLLQHLELFLVDQRRVLDLLLHLTSSPRAHRVLDHLHRHGRVQQLLSVLSGVSCRQVLAQRHVHDLLTRCCDLIIVTNASIREKRSDALNEIFPGGSLIGEH
mmetsp:Transcript_32219/g.54284  ORF Transcript_32219/g.54284 Transcript_32219/m.54284 type:complete len:248 (+) Transcript_32219:440-1183(+)